MVRSIRPDWSFIAGAIVASTAISIYTLLSLHWTSSRVVHGFTRRKKVVLFGDSITQHGWNPEIDGWAAALSFYWFRRVDILNRGYSGYNSRWGLYLLDDVVLQENPDFVTVFFGANDAVDPTVLQHVDIIEYEANIRAIVQRIKQKLPNVPIVLISPPPIHEESLMERNRKVNKPLLLDRTNERAHQYGQVCSHVGKEEDVPFVDLWVGMEGDSAERVKYLSDGLHLSSLGNQRLLALLVGEIERSFPAWTIASLPMDQPDWSVMHDQIRARD